LKKLLKISLFLSLFTALALAMTIPAVNMALENEDIRNNLLERLAVSLGGSLEAEQLSISLYPGNVSIWGKNISGSLLTDTLAIDIPSGRLRLTLSDLLQGRFFPSTLQVTAPRISFQPMTAAPARDQANRNWSSEFNTLLQTALGHGAQITVTDGSLSLAGLTLDKLYIQTRQDRRKSKLNLRTDILYRDALIPVRINGTASRSADFSYGFTVKADAVPLTMIPSWQDFFFSGGTVDLTGTLTGSDQTISLNGRAAINDFAMTVGWTSKDRLRHQEKPYQIDRGLLTFESSLQGRRITMPVLDLQARDFSLRGSFLLDLAARDNPFMDLRLQSSTMEVATLKMLLPDPLINDWTTSTIFPRLKNGTARMTAFRLAGTFEQIQNLNSPANGHCLSWAGILHDVDTLYNDRKPLGRVASALLAMDGDRLEIREIHGKSGKSVMEQGSLVISGMYDHALEVTAEVQGSFSLAWLNRLGRGNLFGTDMEQLLRPVSSLSGQADGSASLSFKLASDRIKLLKLAGRGTVARVQLRYNGIPLGLKIDRGSYLLAFPGTSRLKGNGSWGKSTFNGSLSLLDLDSRKQQLTLTGLADIAELKKTFADTEAGNALAPCVGTLPVKAAITLSGKKSSARGSIDFSSFDRAADSDSCIELLLDNQLEQADFDLSLKNKKLTVNRLLLSGNRGTLQASGSLYISPLPVKTINNLHISAVDFPLQELTILIPAQAKGWQLNGRLTSELNSNLLALDNILQTINGSMTLQGWHGVLINPGITVNNTDLTATLENGRVQLTGSDIRLADYNQEYPLLLQAELKKNRAWDGTVRVYGHFMDLTSSSSKFRKRKTELKKPLPIGSIRLIAGIKHVRYRTLIFSPLLIDGLISADRFVIRRGLLEQANDFVWLTGSRLDDAVNYEYYFKIRKKPVATIMAMFGFENDSISGSMDIEGKLTAKVTPGSTVFETTRGPIYIEVKDGSMKSTSGLIKILDLISLQNLLKKAEIIALKNRFNFSLIQARLDLRDSIFTTSALLMRAPAFDSLSKGSIDVKKDTINMLVKLTPFGTISKIVSAIPYLGYVLTGKSGGLVDYTFSVNGILGSPKVEYIPLKGTIESLTGYLKRLATGRKEVKAEVNSQLRQDMLRKKSFILRMDKELAPLREAVYR
jgi:hypothetical protein